MLHAGLKDPTQYFWMLLPYCQAILLKCGALPGFQRYLRRVQVKTWAGEVDKCGSSGKGKGDAACRPLFYETPRKCCNGENRLIHNRDVNCAESHHNIMVIQWTHKYASLAENTQSGLGGHKSCGFWKAERQSGGPARSHIMVSKIEFIFEMLITFTSKSF